MTTQLEAFPKTTLEVLTELSGIHRADLESAIKALDKLSDDEEIAKRYDKAEAKVAACRALVAAIDQAVVRERERLTAPGTTTNVDPVTGEVTNTQPPLAAVEAMLDMKRTAEEAGCGLSIQVGDDDPVVIASAPAPDKLAEAVKLAVATAAVSENLLVRRLSIGYAHAAQLIDEMERLGVVDALAPGSKARTVLIDEAGLEAVLAKVAA